MLTKEETERLRDVREAAAASFVVMLGAGSVEPAHPRATSVQRTRVNYVKRHNGEVKQSGHIDVLGSGDEVNLVLYDVPRHIAARIAVCLAEGLNS